MAHGTGRYMKPLHEFHLQKDDYCICISRCYNYYYPAMSDCYEPTCEAEDKFEVTLTKWRTDRHGSRVADHLSESCSSGSIDGQEANKIWYNLKHRDITFDQAKAYFEMLRHQNHTES